MINERANRWCLELQESALGVGSMPLNAVIASGEVQRKLFLMMGLYMQNAAAVGKTQCLSKEKRHISHLLSR